MKIEKRKIKDLKAADYNPRRIDDRALAGLTESIKRFGLVEPIIVNQRTGNVVGGHHRLKALAKLGQKETQVVVVDVDEAEEKVMNISLNNPNIQGEFTEDLGPMLEAMEEEIKQALLLTELEAEKAEPEFEFQEGDFEPPPAPFYILIFTTEDEGPVILNRIETAVPGLKIAASKWSGAK